MGKSKVAAIFKKGKEAIRKNEKSNIVDALEAKYDAQIAEADTIKIYLKIVLVLESTHSTLKK